jgi:Zn-dependent protease
VTIEPLVWLVVFVVSVTLHEAAHALGAYLGGDMTAYNAGQVSLNPLPHARREPFGMVILPVLSAFSWGFPMGFASTPYDPDWARRHPRRAGWMAAAGPGANLALALLALAGLRYGLAIGAFFAPDQITFSSLVGADTQFVANIGRFLSMTLMLNAILFAFNLIPFPPLDGAAVITLLLPEETGRRLTELLRNPALALGGLLLAWFLFGEIVQPIWSGILVLVHPEVAYG